MNQLLRAPPYHDRLLILRRRRTVGPRAGVAFGTTTAASRLIGVKTALTEPSWAAATRTHAIRASKQRNLTAAATSAAVASLSSSSWVTSFGAASCEQHAIVSYPSQRIGASDRGNAVRADPDLPASIASSASSTWRNKIRRALRMVRRLIKLSVVLAPVAFLYPLAMLANRLEGGSSQQDQSPQQQSTRKRRDAHEIALESAPDSEAVKGFVGWYLRMCLHCVESSGAAVIKLMQWAGSRPDLFGHEFCSVFSALQDSTTPHPFRHTDAAMRQSYGPQWRNRVQLQDILGSGCIGQVYRGQVRVGRGNKQEMKEVAVKVLHPNVEDDIDADLDLLRVAVRVAENVPLLFKGLYWMNLQGIVEEFAGMLKLQLDLRNEADNLNRFNSNFAKDPNVVFPTLIPGYEPTKNVLIESFCDGVPVLQFAKDNAKNPELLNKLCLTAIHAVCKMIFLDNLMHGDLHPGNVYISRDGKKFILFDVGIVAEYSDDDHNNIVSILAAFIRKQGRKAGRLMIDESNNRLRRNAHVDDNQANLYAIDEESYIDKIELLTKRAASKDYLMEHLGTYITYICNAASQHHIMMNPSFISAALAVKVQEGIALALDPAAEIWRVASPIIIESERRRLTGVAQRKLGLDAIWSRFMGDKEGERKA